jgi:small subunit ribosomal protein S17e
MNRVRKISEELLEKYPNKFSGEFDANKKAILELAKITSKELRNQIAGSITSKLNRDSRVQKEKINYEKESDSEIEEI